ncbi:MAG: hypothetical protein GY829_09915 [Gammaproteobacteria bacterium]|nr:hypothetical protein [Gammaproteobacteria bacterium]
MDLAYLFTEEPVIGGLKYSTSEGGVIELSNDSDHGTDFDESYLQRVLSINKEK